MAEKTPRNVNALDLVLLLAASPGRFSVDMRAVTTEDWQSLGTIERATAGVLQKHDFSPFEEYLETTPYKEQKKTLEALTDGAFLPPEILMMAQALRSLLDQYLHSIQLHPEGTEIAGNNIKDKSIFILMLELLYKCVYRVSVEGLSACEFEENRPPAIDDLLKDLIVLKSLYSTYFYGQTHTVTIQFINEQLAWYLESARAQETLLETFIEGADDKKDRQKALTALQQMCSGFEIMRSALIS
jgi:hypothetical protein